MNLNSKKGMTLSELLIASFVAAVAFVAILGSLTNMSRLTEYNREVTAASIHGQYILEEIKDAGFANLETDINSGNWNFTAAELAANPYNFAVLTWETINTSVITAGNPLHIRVQVNWQDRGSNVRAYILETLRTN